MSVRNKPFSLRPGQAGTAADRVLLGLHEPDPFDAQARSGQEFTEPAPGATASLAGTSPSSQPIPVTTPGFPAPARGSQSGGNIQATVRYPSRYRDLLEEAGDRLGWSGSQTLLVLLEGPLAELEGRVARDGWEEAIRWLNGQRLEQRRRQRRGA